MSMKKKATFSYKCPIKPLNKPTGKEWDIFNFPNQIKTASVKDNKEDLGGFDLKEAVDKYPDHLYIKIFAIKKDEPNDNGDAFSEEELKKSADTFVGVPLFTNHQNDDIEKARGECVHAWYDEERGGIFIIGRVDKIAYPKLARGIEQNYVTGTSMGASRGFDLTLMSNGKYKRVDELIEGDEVVTHSGKKEKIKVICKTQDHKELYNINWNGNNNLALSYEHPVLIIPYEDVYFFNKNKKRYRKNIKDINDTVNPIFREASLVKPGDYVLEYINNEEKDLELIDDEMAFILGVYAAEGYISSNSVGFCFGLDEENDENKNFVKLLNVLQKKYPDNKIRIDKCIERNGLYLVTWNKDLAGICKKYIGCGSHDKFIHSDILTISKEKQKIFLAAYIDGDGCIVKKRILENMTSSGQGSMQVSSASIDLLKGFRKICLRLNVPATLSSHNRICRSSTVVDNEKKYVEHILYITNSISDKIQKYSWKANNNEKALRSKFDSFFYKDLYIAHRVKSVDIIDNKDTTYYVQVGDIGDEDSDHSYILNDIVTHNCSVDYSICSICHNKAHTAEEFCSHIKEKKTRKFSGTVKCKYHKSKVETDDKCPICGSTKNSSKSIDHDNTEVYEHNYGLRFIENSFVVNPACHDCGVSCVLNVPEVTKKVASFKNLVNGLYKDSTNTEDVDRKAIARDIISKIGGMQEIQDLKESMNKVESVVQSMLKQKDHVSIEFVSDLVEAMQKLQETTDELTEMGYGRLPSPDITGDIATPSLSDTAPTAQPVPDHRPSRAEGFGGEVVTDDLNQLGSVTKPADSNKKIKDFSEENINILNKISSLKNIALKLSKNRRNIMSEILGEVYSDGNSPIKVIISKDDDNELFVTEANENNILKLSNISEFSEDMQQLIKEDPEKAGKIILENKIKNIGAKMATKNENTKTAASADNLDIVTEKQLEKKEEKLHPRQEEVYEGVTESEEQIGRKTDANNVTTSESPQKRKGTYETITEDQLNISSIELTRFDDVPDVITEKQWTDFSKSVSAEIADDYTDTITEDQIKQLLENHQFVGAYETITEDQLKNISMTQGLKRWASKDYTVSLMKVATQTISDAIARFKKSPQEMAKEVSYILDNDKIKNKVASLAIVNSLPKKEENRKGLINKIAYFHKTASAPNVSCKDALILSMAENGKLGMKAEDLIDYIGYSLRNKTAMTKVEELVQTKLSSSSVDDQEEFIDKFASFDYALKEIQKPEDGKYRIYATLEDINVSDKKNKEALFKGVKKVAQAEIGDDSVAAAIVKVEVGKNGELIIDIQDGGEDMITPDDIGDILEGPVKEIEFEEEVEIEGDEGDYEEGDEEVVESKTKDKKQKKIAAAKKELKKKAQLMGGEMGGQGGAAQMPGAGAGMPGTEMGDMGAPMETFEEQPIDDDIDLEEESMEPMPPGTICGVCGSQDVDVLDGKCKCNNCTSIWTVKIENVYEKYKGVTPEAEETEETEELDDFTEGEGFELPEESPAIAAYTKLKPEALQKIAENNIELGSISPVTGKDNTVKIDNGVRICLDTGVKYKVSYATDKKGKVAYGQWEYNPVINKVSCSSCSRAKAKLVKALSSIKMSKEQFDKLTFQKKIATITKLSKSGALKNIKTASKTSSIIDEYKVAYGGYGENFPIESCREKLARRFGENAVALSGPCEGKLLYDCVCNQLKNADVYNDKLAIKVAESWSDVSGDEECIEDQVRSGLTIREAVSVCDILKMAVVEPEQLFADELGEESFETDDTPPDDSGMPIDDMEDDIEEDIDPFVDEGTVTIELPKDVVEQINEETGEALEGEEVTDIVPEEPVEPVEPVEDVEDVVEEPVEEPLSDEITEEEFIDETKPCGDKKPCTEFKEDLAEEKNKGISDSKLEVSYNGEKIANNDSEYSYKEASNMKSQIGKSGKISLDLSSVIDSLKKQAGQTEIQQQKAQDTPEIGNYTAGEEGSKIGHEDKTIPSAQKPGVPRDGAIMGKEDPNLNPQDKPQPKIPSDKGTMGNEEEVGLSGGDATYTGGEDGQGKVETASSDFDMRHMAGFESSKSGLGRLADRILEAGEKKLEPKEPVADDKDIQPVQNKKTGPIGKEPEFTETGPDKTEGSGNESAIGAETETLGDRPTSPDNHPSLPADNALMGQEGEDISPEKQTKDKGTVIAEGDSDSEAIRVAGRMLESGRITSSELQTKINELKSYRPAQIRDFEKSIFAEKKGIDTESDGMSQAIVINEASNVRNSQDELSKKLASLFSLEKRNIQADEDGLTQLRKTYGKN